MLTADVNGDGIPDLLFNESGVVDVLLGKGDGTFKPVQKFDSGGGFVFTTGDFNHDGKTDVAVVSSWISTLLNTTGNVVPPPPTGGADFTFALGTSALAVNRGQSASTSMSLAATGGLNDSVTFSCAGLPQGATCSFSPASVTVGGSAQQTVTLTITTAAARAALARDGSWTQMLAFVLPFGFVLIGSGRRTRGMLKRLRAVWLMLAIAGLLALQGCGGVGGSNNSGGTPPPPPPPNTGQTFTVTVSATSANTHITHTQNIALEVR
jgi:hypothetical protein